MTADNGTHNASFLLMKQPLWVGDVFVPQLLIMYYVTAEYV